MIFQDFVASRKVTLIGVYAPQIGNTNYFNLLIKKTEQYREGNVVLMGDFNAVMDQRLDKSKLGRLQSVIPDTFKIWLQEKGFVDAWHIWHQREQQYTFYSGRHDSFPHINYFF